MNLLFISCVTLFSIMTIIIIIIVMQRHDVTRQNSGHLPKMSLYTRRQSKRLTWGDFSSELPSTYFVFSSASFLPLTVYCPSMQFFLFPHDSENQCTFCLYFLLSFPHKVRQCLVTIDSGGFGKIKEPEKNPVLSLEMYVSLPSLFFSFSFSLHPLSSSFSCLEVGI